MSLYALKMALDRVAFILASTNEVIIASSMRLIAAGALVLIAPEAGALVRVGLSHGPSTPASREHRRASRAEHMSRSLAKAAKSNRDNGRGTWALWAASEGAGEDGLSIVASIEKDQLLLEYDAQMQAAIDKEWADTNQRYGIDWFFER